MDVDQRVVVKDLRVMRGDEAHPAHIGGQGIDFLDAASGLQASVPSTQVEKLELVRRGGFILGILDIDAPHPMSLSFEVRHQVVPDESSGTGDDYLGHGPLLTTTRSSLRGNAPGREKLCDSRDTAFISRVETVETSDRIRCVGELSQVRSAPSRRSDGLDQERQGAERENSDDEAQGEVEIEPRLHRSSRSL